MKYCCKMMEARFENCCTHHGRDCPDVIVTLTSSMSGIPRFGIPIHDGGSSSVTINFCPWCGKDLDELLRAPPPQVAGLMIVRLWDMMDGWIDITDPISPEEAKRIWNEKTGDGKHHICYNDGDYYQIFPADTKMRVTPEYLGR